MNRHPDAALAAGRLPFVGALRGFALFGVFGANLMIFSGITCMTAEQKASASTGALDEVVYLLEQFLVENKFIGLLSVLFGISFWLFLDRARARGAAATPLFYRRIGWWVGYAAQVGLAHAWMRRFRFGPAEWLWRTLTYGQVEPFRAGLLSTRGAPS
jgi:uncharacterized membrane protein YeiB